MATSPLKTAEADPFAVVHAPSPPLGPTATAERGDRADTLNFPRDELSALAHQFNGMINSPRSTGGEGQDVRTQLLELLSLFFHLIYVSFLFLFLFWLLPGYEVHAMVTQI